MGAFKSLEIQAQEMGNLLMSFLKASPTESIEPIDVIDASARGSKFTPSSQKTRARRKARRKMQRLARRVNR